MRKAIASTAGPKARITSGAGGPTSRRSTRSAGVRESCNSGGSAKPPSTAIAVRKPTPSGARPGGGRSPRSQPDSTFTSQACAPKPINEPMQAAARPDESQLRQAHRQREGTRRTERLQQRHRIEMPLHVAARGHRHGDGAQQHGHEAGDAEETCRTVDGRFDLRSRVFDVLDFLVRLLVGFEPVLERGDRRCAAPRNSWARRTRLPGWMSWVVARSSSFMIRLGASSRNVAPWSGRLMSMRDTRNVLAPMLSWVPTLTPSAAASRESGHTSPRAGMPLASSGAPNGSSESITLPRNGYFADTARSEVSWLKSPLNTTLKRPVLRADLETASPRFFDGLVVHQLAGFQPQVGRQHLARLVVDRDADAIDEEAHAGERGHRDRDGEHQHAELAGAPFAHHRAQCQCQRSHVGALT